MAEVVESDLWDACPFKDALEHVIDAVRGDGTAVRRGEHIGVIDFPLLLPQDFNRLGRDTDCPVGVLGFQRCFHDLTVYSCYLAAHLDDAILPVDVTPLESEKLTPPQTGCQLDVVHLINAGGFRFLEERLKLLCRDGLHLLVFQLGERHRLARILRDDLLRHGEVHGRGDDLIDIPNRLGGQAFRLFLGFDSLNSTLIHQLAVQLLEIHGAELL